MDKKVKLTAKLKTYLSWPLTFAILWAVMIVVLFALRDFRAGGISLIFFGIYLVFAILLSSRSNTRILSDLVDFATQYGLVQKKLLQEFSVPYAILDADGNFLYMNDEFSKLTGKDRHYNKNILNIFQSVGQDELPLDEEESEFQVSAGDRIYRAVMQRIVFNEGEESSISILEDRSYMLAVVLYDETDYQRLQKEREDQKFVVGMLNLDNYDEALEGVEDVRRSLLLALVERKINQYFSGVDAVVKKLNHDRYFIIMRKASLEKLEKDKFSILEGVKTVNIGNEMSMTISIGIGLGAETFIQDAEAANGAMELALGRGGDQVVIKEGFRTRFFGGKTESPEKMTRVKARVKAQALREILQGKNRVVIMGHQISDIDCIGAAIGIYRAAKTIDKPAYIVADDTNDNVKGLIETFRQSNEYESTMFVDRKKAKELTNADTALVIVDTNKANYTACSELLDLTTTIVVFDHHRQGVGRIENAVLSYIEPYASSSCEMIAEVLQYFDDTLKLKPLEADAMYEGIIVDTNGFNIRTGVRTFEAAAYLRRAGADITRIRKMFRERPEDLKAKAKTVADAEIYDDGYAISICENEGLTQPTVVAAQAANELLNVEGVKASFVMTDYHDTIYISARAIDEVNVQLIMERLGGGGHLNIAGAQLTDTSMDEAVRLLKETIQEMATDAEM